MAKPYSRASDHGIDVGISSESAPEGMEWVTPTGMALLACFGIQSMVIPTGRIEKSVYAAGAANPSVDLTFFGYVVHRR